MQEQIKWWREREGEREHDNNKNKEKERNKRNHVKRWSARTNREKDEEREVGWQE